MLKRALDAVWPRGSAWSQKVGGGMEGLLLGVSDSFDTVHDKLATLAGIRNAIRTEQLDELEIDFGILPDATLTDEVRRARLDARINADHTAGTRDRLEREILAAGFDLYVYANSPAVNPAQFGTIYRTVAGGAKAIAGNPAAVAGIFSPDLLVNGAQERTVSVWRMVAGGGKAFAGNPQALAGRVGITTILRTYAMPVNPAAWPFVFFVGGVASHNVSGELTSIAIAEVPDERRAELEETVLRLKGTYTWAVMVLHYAVPLPFLFLTVAEPLNFVTSNTVNLSHDFEVDWGDGNFISYVAGDGSAIASGAITVRSVNPVSKIKFVTNSLKDINIISSSTLTDATSMCSSLTNLLTFNINNSSNITDFTTAWAACSGLTSFPLIDTSSGTSFFSTWAGCSGLTSFPLVDTSLGTNFTAAWSGCTSLTSFPLIDTSSGTSFSTTWNNCPSLTSFPLIDLSSGTNFSLAWIGCSGLTSFPLVDTSLGTNFDSAFKLCTNLVCLSALNTTSATTAIDLFNNTPALVAPTAGEQTSLATVPPGLNYINAGACP